MDTRDMVQILNTLIATAAIPPSLLLLLTVTRETSRVTPEQKRINRALLILFLGISICSLINTGLAFASIIGSNAAAHALSPYRSLFINMFFSVTSWFIYFAHLEMVKRR